MTKILSINDGILLSKSNVQQAITVAIGRSGSGTTIKFTCSKIENSTVVKIYLDESSGHNAYGEMSLICYGTTISGVVNEGTGTITVSGLTVTISGLPNWATATLVDFRGNAWATA